LLNAMREVNAKLLIAGDGPLREAMERQIERGHLGDRVVLLGMKSPAQLTPLYQACQVFVLASTEPSEAFGIVQLEAMAAGKPVVNTMLDSGVPFVSRHGESGLTVAPRDSHALAAAINRMLEDPVLRQGYGQAGRRRVQRDFSVKRMTSDTLELYGEVLGYSPLIAHSDTVKRTARYVSGSR
jgi:rhamnosyl/mannosyltransferase